MTSIAPLPFLPAVLCLLAGTLCAHGGQYRGPGYGFPAPPGPKTPTPGPTTGGPGGPTTGGSGFDATRWQLWWEYNRDPYLRRRPEDAMAGDAAAGTAVSDAQRRAQILPALVQAIQRTTNRDITTSCLVAIAKIGVDLPDTPILPLLQKRLRRGDQEIRETAALALGITERAEAIEPLTALLLDRRKGRQLVGEAHVDDRTRAFAAYGLGLIAHGHDDLGVKELVLDSLIQVLGSRHEESRDLHVGVINAIKLVAPDAGAGAKGKLLLWRALHALRRYERLDLGRGRELVQAHVAPAMARLLGRGDSPDHDSCKRELGELLRGSDRHNLHLYQSAALALGQLVEPAEDRPDDAPFSAALRRASREATDKQTQYFSRIALGQIGGAANLEHLAALFRSEKGPSRSWTALSLGLLAHDAATPTGQGKGLRQAAGELLAAELEDTKNPDLLGALAIGTGLAHYTPAAPTLRKLLEHYHHSQEVGGYLCVALALMDDAAAVRQIQAILADAARRPILLSQAAMALARLQQRSQNKVLHETLLRGRSDLATLVAAASALGYVGDATSVEPLLRMLRKRSTPKLTRAFAAITLGMIADDDRLPWSSWISKDINYLALVETLSNQSSGVLDIL